MDYSEIVDKLIGPIQPLGETNEDEQRFKNLQEMCTLTEHLVEKIQTVAWTMHFNQHSVQKAGQYADTFLNNLRTND